MFKKVHMYCSTCSCFTEMIVFEIPAFAKILKISDTKNPDRIVSTRRTHVYYDVDCPCCLSKMVEIDGPMANEVKILNGIGLTTRFCCAGHYRDVPAYIMFDDDYLPRWFSEKDFPFPENSMWEYDYGCDNICIRLKLEYEDLINNDFIFNFKKYQVAYMKELDAWIRGIIRTIRTDVSTNNDERSDDDASGLV